ncbi:MAG: phenylpropionate dioxygenase-like ring-hydroxylating dioxygenase large terminal subunit [Halioglobus sp.]
MSSETLSLAARALHHFTQKTTDQNESTMEIPLSAYRDAERYAAEIDRVFKHLPLAAALSLELPDTGNYRAMTLMGVPVLLMRGEDMQVTAMLNVCRHRGARLCAEGAGSRQKITCPYHAWSYDHKGALIGRYGDTTFGDIAEDQYGLTQLHCEEKAGIVWVCLTAGEVFDIDTWLGDFGDELETLDLANWHMHEQRDLPGPGWKVTMDGYLEAYHHQLVHRETVGQYTVGNLLVLDTYGPHQRLTFGRKSLGDLLNQPQNQWQPEEHIRLIHSGFPNLSISGILGDHCLVSQVFPGKTPSTTITRQTILVAQKPRTQEQLDATEAFSALTLKAVQEEDYGIGFSIQSGLESAANDHFLFGRNEPAVQNYHRWIAKFMDLQNNNWQRPIRSSYEKP